MARNLGHPVTRGAGWAKGVHFDVSGFAQPLVQQLSMNADHRYAEDDGQTANRFRAEAGEATSNYLSPTATAAVQRDRAMLARN